MKQNTFLEHTKNLSSENLPDKTTVSFEFFPPKDQKAEETLWRAVKRLEPLNPAYVSVTYGAGGSTRERTHATVVRIKKETKLEPAAHLTCINSSEEQIREIAEQYWNNGIRHIVALRGDIPKDQKSHVPGQRYTYAFELVQALKKIADFEVTVAAYPEVHPEALSAEADIDNLKRKIDAGASRVITQFFLDNTVYYRFLDKVLCAGINIPIIPGILPVTNFQKVIEFASGNRVMLPERMAWLFSGLDNDPTTRQLVAATVAAEQCRELSSQGVKAFHFYTLNRADLSYAICHILGIRENRCADGTLEKPNEPA